MNRRTRLLTFSAFLIALTVVLLYISSILPTAKLGITASAGLMTAACVIEFGITSGVACFVCSALVSLFLIPDKSVALLYILFFGYYPIIKSLIERLNRLAVEWILKLILFNAALTAVYLLWSRGFMPDLNFGSWFVLLIYAAGNVCFVLYDLAFTRLASFYLARISKKR